MVYLPLLTNASQADIHYNDKNNKRFNSCIDRCEVVSCEGFSLESSFKRNIILNLVVSQIQCHTLTIFVAKI